MSIKVYRLLRNNKEEGPYTAEELIQQNLRPYDLIWVDGSSGAWRYPGEITQFKKYAPLPGEESEINDLPKNQPVISPSVQAAIAVNNNINATSKPRYKISAAWNKVQTITTSTLNNAQPGNQAKSTIKPNMVAGHINTLAAKSLSWEQAWLDWEKEKKSVNKVQPSAIAPASKRKKGLRAEKNNEPVLETKYAEPLDSIKEKYVDNLLQQKVKKRGNSAGLLLPVLALIIIFSVAYWLLKGADIPIKSPQQKVAGSAVTKNNTGNQKENVAQTAAEKQRSLITNKQTGQTVKQTKEILPATSTPAYTDKDEKPAKSTPAKNVAVTTASKDNIQAIADNIHAIQKTIQDVTLTKVADKPASASTNNKPAETTAAAEAQPVKTEPVFLPGITTENAQAVKPEEAKKIIADYINVPANISMHNGMANIKLENISNTDLDLVVLDVQYFNSSNNFRKGETFYVHNLKAGRNVIIKTSKDMASDHAISKVSLISSDSDQLYIVGDN